MPVVGNVIPEERGTRSRPVMQSVISDGRGTRSRPVVPAWFCAGVVGTCGWRAREGDRSAEHAYAADRFAREIVGFLTCFGGALAAADRQTVGRAPRQRLRLITAEWN